MRAYLAVVKDSFREALASRVLWILLALITLLLVVAALPSIGEESATTLGTAEILDADGFAKRLVEQGGSSQPTPGRRVWELLSPDLKERLAATDADFPATARRARMLLSELNELLQRRDFFDRETWSDVELSDEANRLLEQGVERLSEHEVVRLNRLALQGAFAQHVKAADASHVYVHVFGYKLGETLPVDRPQADEFIKGLVQGLITLFVGAIGVFLAILVTASIIPQMFEPGSIDLLLSKPVSRSLLFLTKFFGGCAFILLNASYFIVGVWLIAGLRFGIWNSKLLLCIPVFLFLFAIYYSVSALAGVVWRNAVVCVVVTILFWGACFVVGASKGGVETMLLNPKRFAVLIPAGESLLASNKSGDTFQWSVETGAWSEIFAGESSGPARFGFFFPMIGPVYDARGEQIVAIERGPPSFVGRGAGKLLVGKRADEWQRVPSVAAPPDAESLFLDPAGRIVVAGTRGVQRFEGDPAVENAPFRMWGVDVTRWVVRSGSGQFVVVGPNATAGWKEPFAAAMDRATGRVAIYSAGSLAILQLGDDDKFAVRAETKLDSDQPAVLGFARDTILLATSSGAVQTYDAATLKAKEAFVPFDKVAPKSVAVSWDGRWFAVLYHHQKLWLFDAQERRPVPVSVAGQGDISAVGFSEKNTLFVADRFPRVIEYDAGTWNTVRRFETDSDWLELVYRFGLLPLYSVFPKPGELDNLVSYLLTEQQTAAVGGNPNDLGAERVVLNVWEPFLSSLAFLVAVLFATCAYIARKDF